MNSYSKKTLKKSKKVLGGDFLEKEQVFTDESASYRKNSI